jgi:hypothetical protein
MALAGDRGYRAQACKFFTRCFDRAGARPGSWAPAIVVSPASTVAVEPVAITVEFSGGVRVIIGHSDAAGLAMIPVPAGANLVAGARFERAAFRL